jgi:exonuclease V gamma subunit
LEEAATLARRRGELPPLQGFEELSFQELQKSLEGKKQKLHQMGIHQEDLFSIELSEQVDRIEKEPTKIWVPALSVGGYLIKGQLYPVCCKGLLWMGGTTPEDRPLLWPSFLVFSCLAEELKMPKECLFVEGVRNKQLNVAIKHPKELLERYIKLYERSLQDPCPLLPQWAWLFSSKEVSSWDERLQSSLYSVSDPFIKWVLKRDALPLGSWMLKQWQSHWKEVFSPLFAGGQDEDV